MAASNFTATRARELLNYDSQTGLFTWKVGRPKASMGALAGSITKDGYVMLTIDRAKVYAHRVAWLFEKNAWPAAEIDHINGVRHDNRIENLRDVSPSVNQQNVRRARCDNKSGFLGVTRQKNLWTSQLTIGGKTLHLGLFRTPEEASEAYLKAKRKHHDGCTI